MKTKIFLCALFVLCGCKSQAQTAAITNVARVIRSGFILTPGNATNGQLLDSNTVASMLVSTPDLILSNYVFPFAANGYSYTFTNLNSFAAQSPVQINNKLFWPWQMPALSLMWSNNNVSNSSFAGLLIDWSQNKTVKFTNCTITAFVWLGPNGGNAYDFDHFVLIYGDGTQYVPLQFHNGTIANGATATGFVWRNENASFKQNGTNITLRSDNIAIATNHPYTLVAHFDADPPGGTNSKSWIGVFDPWNYRQPLTYSNFSWQYCITNSTTGIAQIIIGRVSETNAVTSGIWDSFPITVSFNDTNWTTNIFGFPVL